jgi:hypothetical protein
VRSRVSRLVFSVAVVVTVMAASPVAQPPSAIAPISRAETAEAIAKVKRDPNLGSERTIGMLRWRTAESPKRATPGWVSWITGLFRWIMQSARYLVWVALALLAGWLGVYLTRTFRHNAGALAIDEAFVAPTHVRNLDIRPESLPANIGDAARLLWDRGDHRAALSLLYRGLLSRLTHVHRVPIVDSTTEGDCLSLLPGRVSPATGEYASRLVDAWRAFVYGGTSAPPPAVHALCEGFAGALDRRVSNAEQGGAAR